MIISDSRRPYLNKFFKKIKKRLETKRKKTAVAKNKMQRKSDLIFRIDLSNEIRMSQRNSEKDKFVSRKRREIQNCLFAFFLNKLKLFVNFFFARNSSRKVRFLKIRLNFCQSQLFLNKKSCRWAENFTCVVKLLLNSAVYVRNSFRPT